MILDTAINTLSAFDCKLLSKTSQMGQKCKIYVSMFDQHVNVKGFLESLNICHHYPLVGKIMTNFMFKNDVYAHLIE